MQYHLERRRLAVVCGGHAGAIGAEGQGRVAGLSRETATWLKLWLDHAKFSEGPTRNRSKPLPNWGQFAICYRNFRSQRKEYGK